MWGNRFLQALLAVTGNMPTGAEAICIMDSEYDSLKVAMYNMSEDMMRMKGDWQMYMDIYEQYNNGLIDMPSVLRALENMKQTQSALYDHMLSYTIQENSMQMSIMSSIINSYVVM